MRYPISKVEKILGISQSTIRRYEEEGLIHVRRVEEGTYRYFSTADIARLSIFLGMRIKGFLPKRLRNISEHREDPTLHIRDRLIEIDKEIERLQAEKHCWEQHLELSALMEKLKTCEEKGIISKRKKMLITPFEDEKSMRDTLFFELLRDGSIQNDHFRLGSMFKQEDFEQGRAETRHIFIAQLDKLRREEIVRMKQAIYLPDKEYILACCPDSGVIDEEDPEGKKKTVMRVFEQARELLEKLNCKLDGDIMTMTVTLDRDESEAILFIPVRRGPEIGAHCI